MKTNNPGRKTFFVRNTNLNPGNHMSTVVRYTYTFTPDPEHSDKFRYFVMKEHAIEQAYLEYKKTAQHGYRRFYLWTVTLPMQPEDTPIEIEGWLGNVRQQYANEFGEVADDWISNDPSIGMMDDLRHMLRRTVGGWLDRNGLRPSFYLLDGPEAVEWGAYEQPSLSHIVPRVRPAARQHWDSTQPNFELPRDWHGQRVEYRGTPRDSAWRPGRLIGYRQATPGIPRYIVCHADTHVTVHAHDIRFVD